MTRTSTTEPPRSRVAGNGAPRTTAQPGAATPAGGYRPGLPWRVYRAAAQALDRVVGWDRLPVPLGLAVIAGLRDALRRHNLHDTGTLPTTQPPAVPPFDPQVLTSRTVDGSYNDLAVPSAGMAGSRFGRNVPLVAAGRPAPAEVVEPSPREVSRQLMTRDELIPARSVNALVAPWLQWMIRDWFSHGKSPTEDPWRVELADDDPWPERPMLIMRTPEDPTRPDTSSPRTSVNTCTHWWDASQIYGVTAEQQREARTFEGGKLRVEADGMLPTPRSNHPVLEEPGFWLGLVPLQTLFTREHNAVCDMLTDEFPAWGDEQLFQRARLVVAALTAKIHTVEWTPAVISHPTTAAALRANWWGLAGERLSTVFGRLSDSELVSGIPGSPTRDYGVPYSLTEEFTAVYRMHPLMPDLFDLRSHEDDRRYRAEPYSLRELAGPGSLALLDTVPVADLLYSFGTEHPGLVTLHNFPRTLQEFVRPDGKVMDLAAVDILRHRELGVPRYCEFRRLLRLRAPAGFEELTGDPDLARHMSQLYGGDVEKVDLMVGLFAERLPEGFAFSDTAFRIFILMASRRLNSDRFLAGDFTPAVYTVPGMRWLADNTMASLILRHHPQLRPAMRSVTNAFLPWQRPGVRPGGHDHGGDRGGRPAA
ncbi:peroxidase family protein [Geodermatophilus obscurus]|uniref:Animal heme peroxidase n=1 Tax=Geodermatophilus obscurus (strain ATCC 25078 / DSM 43160 / JCM 3152 / CCUG 61914 / KCC A-0152 / KCTC 9177 / NBRC 13315 / NRRL B-3577 / G-20) TaxID=526225 RepID=D2S4I0_GEOOG|nr:peroxidase family protein [Geodermatophilus obscurus]ADB75170.1 Animal heme peroxidase [Geodermatophilus obscurus DSM 43160]